VHALGAMSKQSSARVAHELAATLVALCAGCAATPATSSPVALKVHSILSQLPVTPLMVSTVPPSGDENPYGVAFVPDGFPAGGTIAAGDIVVSNFNNSGNVQGTGSTIVAVHPDGSQTLFFQGPLGLGLSTALGVLRGGFVIVGNVPSTNGSGTCVQHGNNESGAGRGMLLVLDLNGNVVNTFEQAHLLDGPWDLTVSDGGDHASLFVSSALNGTVTRVDLSVGATVDITAQTQIGSSYLHRCDPAAFVVGPTGVALDEATDTLYVASTGDNAIFAIAHALVRTSDAGTGSLFIFNPHLHGPLGLVIAPNGDFLTTQGDAVNPDPRQPSELVEFDPIGNFLAEMGIDPASGAAFGLAIEAAGSGFIFAAVDDATNVLDVWTVP
jgi:hypothetical protein